MDDQVKGFQSTHTLKYSYFSCVKNVHAYKRKGGDISNFFATKSNSFRFSALYTSKHSVILKYDVVGKSVYVIIQKKVGVFLRIFGYAHSKFDQLEKRLRSFQNSKLFNFCSGLN
jgi:hypothetical protein